MSINAKRGSVPGIETNSIWEIGVRKSKNKT